MKEKLWPAVGAAVAVARTSWPAGAAFTVRLAVADRLLAASDALSVCAPALISVAENVPSPLVRVASRGRTTPDEVSLLLK